jgi:hypothetical protein
VELTEEILSRLQQTTPVPSRTALLVALAVGLLLVLIAWRPVRLLTTVCHEAGHALVAVLAGRRLRGVRVHSDTSGLTLSRGRPSGPGMVFTLLAGYPAGSLVGLVGVWLVLGGHGYLFAWLLAGPRTVLEAWGRPGSDAAQLAALTRVPRAVWTLLWLALGLGALALAGAWTLPFLL